jgi:hypothetical protein
MKKRLITYIWECSIDERDREIYDTLDKNYNSKLFDEIFIFSESDISDKLKIYKNVNIIKINHRPTFQFMFEYINVISNNEDINILANSDIFFDETLKLIENINEDEFYCVTRHELDGNLFFEKFNHEVLGNYSVSQDVWIWRGQFKAYDCDFFIGYPGCDNKLAYRIVVAGYKIKNPCLSLKCYHNHSSKIRPGSSKTNGEGYKNSLTPKVIITPSTITENSKWAILSVKPGLCEILTTLDNL